MPHFKPSLYKISVKSGSDLALLEITGQKFGAPNKRLTLNQKGLRVKNAQITYHQKNKVIEHQVARINHLPSFEEVRLHTSSPLYPGGYQISLEFGPINIDGLKGLDASKLPAVALRELLPSFDNEEARLDVKIELLS